MSSRGLCPLKIGNYRLTAEYLDKYVDENTICVVAIAGQTFTGEDDEIQEIHDWLDDYEKKTGVYFYMDYVKNGLIYDAAQSGLFTGVGVKF